jgi:hypothetical protein
MILKINKEVLLQEDGIWDKQQRAGLQHNVNIDQVMSDNFQNNKLNYFANPFVAGPLNHLSTKIGGAIDNIKYNIIKDNDSPMAPTTANITADVTKGPWNAEMDVRSNSLNQLASRLDSTKSTNPIQYYFNPFVTGSIGTDVTDDFGNMARRQRRMFSYTTSAGDTIK